MTNRRNARDRVFRDHGTDDYPVLNDGQPVDLSGTPGNSQLPRSVTPPRPGEDSSPSAGHRRQVMVDAQQSARLDSYCAQALVHAAHAEDQRHFAAQKDTSPGALLRHLFTPLGDRAD